MRAIFPSLALALCTGCMGPVLIAPPPAWVGSLPVAYEWDDRPRGNAASYTDPETGQCVVLIHPERLPLLGPEAQHWTLLHEIAHCAGARSELDADCDATESLALAPASLATLVAHVQDYPASDRHPPGAVRAARILECAP